MALRQLSRLLPEALAGAAQAPSLFAFQAQQRGFKAVADMEINFSDRETLKKYVGVRDHLSKEPGTRGRFMEVLLEVKEAVKGLPIASDYRRAVEATSDYRLKVCKENDTDGAVEEVLDAHLEELIKECKEEMRLVPIIAGACMRCGSTWVVASVHARHGLAGGPTSSVRRHRLAAVAWGVQKCQSGTL
jgi:NADH dehydrogenase (ubiquinone) 1 alpha subcomplex subunit 5